MVAPTGGPGAAECAGGAGAHECARPGVLTVAILAATAFRTRHIRATPARSPTLVVLGAIQGPDSTLTLAVREALRSALEGDPTIRVLGDTRTRETLRLMARPADARL